MIAYAGFVDDAGKARSVVSKLQEIGLDEKETLIIEPKTGDELKKAVASAKNREFLTPATTERARAGLEKGRTLVAAKARLGTGTQVTNTFDEMGVERLPSWGARTGPKFFSDWIGIPLLSPSRSPSRDLKPGKPVTGGMISLISSQRSKGDSSFGIPLLSGQKSKGDSSFGIPLLSGQRSKGESSFGLPLLSNRATKKD